MKTAPVLRDSFGFFQATKIGLMSQTKRFQRVDFSSLTDEKHILIHVNYNGKFGNVINIYDEAISNY